MNITEIATYLGVSKKTIYRKIDKLELNGKGYVKQNDKGKTVTDEGFELIKQSMTPKNVKVKMSKRDNVKADDSTIESFERIIEFQAVTFKGTIADLKGQLIEKDRLIEDLRKDKDRLMQMQENSQVLLVREQERTLLLEESVEKKGFWSKLKKN